MTLLLLAALLWIAVHVGISGTSLRGALVARIGEGGFMAAFSVASVVSITLLVSAYNAAPTSPIWFAPLWLRHLLALVMLIAFVLLAAGALAKSPTAAGGTALLAAEPRGILRVTRHPMLCSFALWGIVHVIGNGDTASAAFFGAFLVTALAGMPSIDHKLAGRDPAGFRALAARTSILPFGAILAGRNRFAAGEIGWVPPVAGLVLWGAILYFHRWIFGVSPLAG
jgi:uncharacterized membrane protein